MDIGRRICGFDCQLEMYEPTVKHQWVLLMCVDGRAEAAGTCRADRCPVVARV